MYMRLVAKLLVWICFFNFHTFVQAADIASVEQALTLAQIKSFEKYDTLLILNETEDSVEDREVISFNLSRFYNQYPDDPLDLITAVGADTIRNDLQENRPMIDRSRYLDLVISPVIGGAHVAAGTNYKAHGDEVEIDHVFLFPKFSEPTPHIARISAKPDTLMDYEIELCARFDRDISSKREFEQSVKGIFLCGDYTDRATLLRKIDVDDVTSGRGFTDAKSGVNRFPVGPYTVVPNDWVSFLDNVEMKLWVNGALRQDAKGDEMIDKLDDIVFNSLAQGLELRWTRNDVRIPLLQNASINKGQVVLTGTPEGVVFRKPSTSFKVMNGAEWFFSFSFLSSAPINYVIEEYIAEEKMMNKYLQPGDNVRMQASYLGEIWVSVVN